jgi:hypothetical protein
MRIENAEWKPSGRRGVLSKSTEAMYALKVGDVKRIVHDDVACKTISGHGQCTLAQVVKRLRNKKGWKLDYYHEKRGILIVRRTK